MLKTAKKRKLGALLEIKWAWCQFAQPIAVRINGKLKYAIINQEVHLQFGLADDNHVK